MVDTSDINELSNNKTISLNIWVPRKFLENNHSNLWLKLNALRELNTLILALMFAEPNCYNVSWIHELVWATSYGSVYEHANLILT